MTSSAHWKQINLLWLFTTWFPSLVNLPFVCQVSTTLRWTRAQSSSSRFLRLSCTRTIHRIMQITTLPFFAWLRPSSTQRTPSRPACQHDIWPSMASGLSGCTRWADGGGGVRTDPPHTSCSSWRYQGSRPSSAWRRAASCSRIICSVPDTSRADRTHVKATAVDLWWQNTRRHFSCWELSAGERAAPDQATTASTLEFPTIYSGSTTEQQHQTSWQKT